MAANGDLYADLPLNQDRNTIRLIQFPSDTRYEDEIVCGVQVVSLDDNPNYIPLSYVWGEAIFSHQIVCNGQQIYITAGLYCALKRCRRLLKPDQALWVDQICVNQGDLSERSAQVLLMTRIYSTSYSFVDLGDEDEWTDRACIYAESQLYRRESETGFLVKTPWTCEISEDAKRDNWGNYLEAFLRFLSRPWFRRTWTIQEVVLPCTPLMLCGKKVMLFSALCPIVNQLREDVRGFSHIEYPQKVRLVVLTDLWRERHQETEHASLGALFHFLKFASFFSVTDPKDQFYAFLGLASDREEFPQPDYTADVATVRRDFAKALIAQGRGLECLDFAGFYSAEHQGPSWVPDWNSGLRGYLPPLFYEPCATPPKYQARISLCKDSNALEIQGRVVTELIACTETFEGLDYSEKILARLHCSLGLIRVILPEDCPEDAAWQLLAILLLLTAKRSKDQHKDDIEWFPRLLEDLKKGFGSTIEWCDMLTETEKNDFGYAGYGLSVMSAVENLSFGITPQAQLALIRPTSRPGDLVGIFLGAATPCILRRGADDTYQFVGPALIVDGIGDDVTDDTGQPVGPALIVHEMENLGDDMTDMKKLTLI